MGLINQIMTKEEFFSIKLPGVTTILGNVFGKDEFKDIPKPVLDAAAERGSKVHEYIEYFIHNGEWPEIELAYQVYIDYFMEWYNKYQPKWISSEQMLADEELGFKGIVDVIFEYTNDDGKRVICMCDWKTSSNLNRFKTMCQLNLYRMLAHKYLPDVDITEIRTLSLTKNEWRFPVFELNQLIGKGILYFNNLKRLYNNE